MHKDIQRYAKTRKYTYLLKVGALAGWRDQTQSVIEYGGVRWSAKWWSEVSTNEREVVERTKVEHEVMVAVKHEVVAVKREVVERTSGKIGSHGRTSLLAQVLEKVAEDHTSDGPAPASGVQQGARGTPAE